MPQPPVRPPSTIDLILLGMVLETPRSAYDILKQVEYRNLSHWVRVSTPSIYKKVLRLQKQGYLKGESTQGKKAEKTVYTLTEAGRDYFAALMRDITSAPIQVLFDFNAVVANINKIPPPQGLRAIQSLGAGIRQARDYIARIQPQRENIPLVGRTIMRQQVLVLDALGAWAAEFEAEFRAQHNIPQGEG